LQVSFIRKEQKAGNKKKSSWEKFEMKFLSEAQRAGGGGGGGK
jgi:hypothetical protein